MIWQRIKNLWQLSRFKITEFDNKLVITARDEDGHLVVNEPKKMAVIIKRKTEKDIISEVLNS